MFHENRNNVSNLSFLFPHQASCLDHGRNFVNMCEGLDSWSRCCGARTGDHISRETEWMSSLV